MKINLFNLLKELHALYYSRYNEGGITGCLGINMEFGCRLWVKCQERERESARCRESSYHSIPRFTECVLVEECTDGSN
jgi:hypothetical protein